MFTPRDKDEQKWLEETADYVKGLDLPHLAEIGLYDYLVEMGKSDKRALHSQVIRLIVHLLKFRYQPSKATVSWETSVRSARKEIMSIVKFSPSLKKVLIDYLQDDEVYEEAKEDAEDETGLEMPDENPFTPEQILDRKFFGKA